MQPSARHPERLCEPAVLMQRCVSLAVLDAIISLEWEHRYYSFDPHWGDAMMASMRTGSGDELFIAFRRGDALLKGFDHEARMAPANNRGHLWPGMYDGMPDSLFQFRDDPALDPESATYCLWWLDEERQWRRGVREFASGADPDGSLWQLAIYDGSPQTYADYAAEVHELDVPVDAIRAVYDHQPLTRALVRAVNPGADLSAVKAETARWPYG